MKKTNSNRKINNTLNEMRKAISEGRDAIEVIDKTGLTPDEKKELLDTMEFIWKNHTGPTDLIDASPLEAIIEEIDIPILKFIIENIDISVLKLIIEYYEYLKSLFEVNEKFEKLHPNYK
jgi:hypothetical protein